MAVIYLTKETLERLDAYLAKYNDKNPPTDRSGIIDHLLKRK